MPYHQRMAELYLRFVQESDGGYCAECLMEGIFTQGDSWEELRRNVVEATSAFFFDPQTNVQEDLLRSPKIRRRIRNSTQLFLHATDFIFHVLFAVGARAETQGG